MGSNKSPLAKATGHSLDEVSIKFGRGMDRFINRNNPEAIAKIDEAIATNLSRMKSTGPDALNGLEVVRDTVGGDRVQSKVWSYVGIDAIYTLITSVSLFVSTRILGGLIGKEQSPSYPTGRVSKTAKPAQMALPDNHVYQQSAPEHADAPGTKLAHAVHLERLAPAMQAHELTT